MDKGGIRMRVIMISICFWLLFIWFLIRQFLKIQHLERIQKELQKQLANKTIEANTAIAMYEGLKNALNDNMEAIASAKH